MALIGIILLIGIVKKNAIMMIDFALEAERNEGKSPEAAIFEACILRFRPITMTTMAALLGGLPLALGTGTGSELRRPLGIAIVGGLIFSQMLTLYTTPVVYLYLDRFRLWGLRLRADLRRRRSSPPWSPLPPASTPFEPLRSCAAFRAIALHAPSIAVAHLFADRKQNHVVFARFVIEESFVEIVKVARDRSQHFGWGFVIKQSLGFVFQVAEIQKQMAMLVSQRFGLAMQPGRRVDGVLEIAVSLFQRKVQGELIAQLSQHLDQLARSNAAGLAAEQLPRSVQLLAADRCCLP